MYKKLSEDSKLVLEQWNDDQKNKREHVNMEIDQYSIAFVSYIRSFEKNYAITALDRAKIMHNVIFTFFIQFTLILFIGQDFIKENLLIKSKIHVALTRFFCAYLLHFTLLPEVQQSLDMFKYWCNHSNVLVLAGEKAQSTSNQNKIAPDQDNQNENESIDSEQRKVAEDAENQTLKAKNQDLDGQEKPNNEDHDLDNQEESKTERNDSTLRNLAENTEIQTAKAIAQAFNSQKKPKNEDHDQDKETIADEKNDSTHRNLAKNAEIQTAKADEQALDENAVVSKDHDQDKKTKEDEKNDPLFINRLPPLIICVMQLFTCLLTEIISLLVICRSGTVIEVVMDFVALEVIAAVDNIYASTIKDLINTRIIQIEAKGEKEWRPKFYWNNDSFDKTTPEKTRKWWNKLIFFLYKTLDVLYFSIYYYFLPVVAIILTYLVPSNINCEEMEQAEDGYCGD